MSRIKSKKHLNIFGIFALTLLILLSAVCPAAAVPVQPGAHPDATYYAANRLYAKNQFAAAAEKYQELIRSGYRSGPLFYNLGNAYYKLGRKGEAVLYYEKARRLMPQDADLKANLTYIHADNGWLRGITHLAYLFEPNQLYIATSVWFFILAALICLAILLPAKVRLAGEKRWKPWFQGILYVESCCLGLSLLLAGVTFYEQNQPQAVVIREHCPVRFEPNAAGTVYYQLNEGSVIKVLEHRGGWLMIRRPDGKRGWIAANSLEMI